MFDASGVYAPLVTPFTDDGFQLSEIRLARLMRHLAGKGVSGYVICSEAGEFTTVSLAERKSMIEVAVRESNGKPVFVNASALSTSAALDLAQHSKRHGARAAVVMPPYYGSYTDQEFFTFFDSLDHHAGTAVVVVDPLNRLSEEVRAKIGGLPSIVLANPGSSSERFTVDELVVDPLALVRPADSLNPEEDPLNEHFLKWGGARLGKAIFEAAGLDMGPVRGPLRAIPSAEFNPIRALLEAG